jgi:cysteine desulfurase
MRRVFLDHHSTTPVLPEVLEAMRPFWAERFGSPGSRHELGLRAREALATARAQVAALIHAESPDDILFTSGATESANLAIKGTAWANPHRGRHLVLTATEHPAVSRSVEFLEQQGFTSTRVRVDAQGLVDPAEVRAAVTGQTLLICVHHVNHEVGAVEPIAEIGQWAAEQGIPLLVDAVASGGWLPIDVQAMGARLLSLSPHRFYGPKGVGVLYRHRRARLASLLHGGLQEGGLRAGTENVPAIVGAGVAAALAAEHLGRRAAQAAALQQRLWDGIRCNLDWVRLNGPELGPRRSPANLNVSLEFVEGEGLALLLDLQGVAVTSGPACVSRSLQVSPVLTAIGLPPALAQGSLLFSLGQDNTPDEIDFAVQVLLRAVARLRAMSAAWNDFQRGVTDSQISPGTTRITPA